MLGRKNPASDKPKKRNRLCEILNCRLDEVAVYVAKKE